MSDLSEFLLARIAEDEELARAASPGPWHVDAESAVVLAVDGIEVCDGFALSGPQLRATTWHIANWNPARVLAECEAKRRVVKLHHSFRVRTRNDGLDWDYQGCGECAGPDDLEPGQGYWPCSSLRLLALPYADHPDYDEEWRP